MARLTDYQIEMLYARPARERAERLDRERRGLPADPPGAAGDDMFAGDRLPTREEFVERLAAFKSPAELHADYDAIVAARAANTQAGEG